MVPARSHLTMQHVSACARRTLLIPSLPYRFLAAYAYRSTTECGKYNTSSQCYAATAQQCSWYGNVCGLEVTSFFDPNVRAMRGRTQPVVLPWHGTPARAHVKVVTASCLAGSTCEGRADMCSACVGISQKGISPVTQPVCVALLQACRLCKCPGGSGLHAPNRRRLRSLPTPPVLLVLSSL